MVTVFNTVKEFRQFVCANRKQITNVNGVNFYSMCPMLEVTNKKAMFYDVESQGIKFFDEPFVVTHTDNTN